MRSLLSDWDQLTHPPPGIISSWLLWGPVAVPIQSGLCRVKAVASHPEDHLTLEEIKPRMHPRDYKRDLELSSRLDSKCLMI